MLKHCLILVLLQLPCLMTFATVQVVNEFKVEPLSRYKLSFNASGNDSIWEIQIFNEKGLLPYEGVFKQSWQQIVPDRKAYTYSFLTPRDGALLKFIINYSGTAPEVSNVKLEKITDENPVINNDFSAGLYNYSGWNTHHLAKLKKDKNGKTVLRCQPTGYALTDPIPVIPGATYRFTKGSYDNGRILIYDEDLLRVDWISDYNRRKKPLLKMPDDAAFIRIEYCDGRAWQKGRVPVINRVGIELVEKGAETKKAEYPPYDGEIILQANSAPSEVRAAREIQHWVRKISGKRINVLAKPSGRINTKIYIGRHYAEKLFPGDINYLKGSDGFAVRKKGHNIYIFGARPSGALFGAIRFLEKNSDLIFARPRKEFGTIYSKNPNLVFKNTNFRLRPAFLSRGTGSPYASRSDDGIWQGRNGLNSGAYYYNQFRRKEMGGVSYFCSNYMQTIAKSPSYTYEICKEKYPELFACVNGKRTPSPHSYICPTHPIAAKAIAAGLCEAVKDAKEKGENLEFLGVRVKDGWTVCSCEECMKPIKLPNGELLKPKADTAARDPLFFSTRKAVMLNKVAEEFAKTHPNIPITVECYIYTSEPPAIPYKPSLVPKFCAYDTSSLRFPILDGENNHPLWKRRFTEFLKRNKKDNRKLSMFAYYYVAGFSAVADTAAADWLAMVKSGNVHSIHLDSFTPDLDNYRRRVQYRHMWDHEAVERWIICRLMWDPTLDPQELREYYIKRTYGNAAPEMLVFYNTIRNSWKDPKNKTFVNCHSSRPSLFEAFIVKPGHEKKLRKILVTAEKKADNPKSKILIQRTITAYDRFADTLSRIYIPYVVESTAEWDMANSTFWMQALKFGPFKKISTWDDFKNAPADNPTNVSVMRDKENLYFRFQALKAADNDRVELVITPKRGATSYYFALNRKGQRFGMKKAYPWNSEEWGGKVENEEDSYTAMFKIPLSVIKELDTNTKDIKLFVKLARVVSTGKKRKESSLTGVAVTMAHYMNYWTALTIKAHQGVFK